MKEIEIKMCMECIQVLPITDFSLRRKGDKGGTWRCNRCVGRYEAKERKIKERLSTKKSDLKTAELERRLRKADFVLRGALKELRARLPKAAAVAQIDALLEEWR